MAVFKWLINRSKRAKCETYREAYERYANGKEEESTLQQIKPRVIRLFRQADVHDVGISTLSSAQNLRTTRLQTTHYDPGPLRVFDLFPTRRADLIPLIIGKFNEASGTYDHRMQDAVNPFYWIESIAYLPKRTAAYLGISTESMLTKTVSVIYWLVWLIGTLGAALIGSDLFLRWVESIINSR